MSDLEALGGIGAIVLGLRRVLGPAADEAGEALRRWTEYRLRNVGRVLENAGAKVKDDSGEVPMRVAMRVLEDASYSDDDVMVEYLGGVLASSHSLVGRDDRGAAWTTLVSSLSSYQLRFHYVLYREAVRLLGGREVELGTGAGADHPIYFPLGTYLDVMAFSGEEDADALTGHILFGLSRNDLIGEGFSFASEPEAENLKRWRKRLPEGGMVARINALGAELFLWAHGHGNVSPNRLLDPAMQLEARTASLPTAPGACLVSSLPDAST